MFIGQTLVAETFFDGSNNIENPSVTYSPWFPSSGDAATFVVEVTAMSDQIPSGDVSSPELAVEIMTKNTEEIDPGTGKGSMTISDVGTNSVRIDELLELVRFKFTLSDTEGDPQPRVFYSTFRMLTPAWEMN